MVTAPSACTARKLSTSFRSRGLPRSGPEACARLCCGRAVPHIKLTAHGLDRPRCGGRLSCLSGFLSKARMAMCHYPNIVDRIPGLVASDTLLISAATYRFVQGNFACHVLGTQ